MDEGPSSGSRVAPGLPTERIYSFGLFRLNPIERTLLRAGHHVSLTPKAFDTLVALVERSGHVVEKDELMKRVWPDTFVEEATLAQNIFTLRKALGDSPRGLPYIETVPKVGYRFTATVAPAETRPVPFLRSTPHRLWLAAAVVVMAAVGAYFFWPRLAHTAPSGRVMLVVLPFENLSGDSAQDYLGEGLTEEMITQLGQLQPERLGVIARTTAMTYRGTQKSAAEIGRELGTDYLLEGSVRRMGDRVRISAQLIALRDQTHIWAENYERDVKDVLGLESEVASAIARHVQVTLTPAARKRLGQVHPVNPKAYESYLKGRYFWNQRKGETTLKAREYFQRAIEADPSDARSYAGLAETYTGALWDQRQAIAAPAVARALALDDSLSDAHTSNAILKMYAYDWEGAEKEFRRAIELDPNSVPARIFLAQCLQASARNDEAVAELKRALEADPLSELANQALGSTLFFARRYDEAADALRKTIELDPRFIWAPLRLARVYEQQGRFAEAEAEFQEAARISPDSGWERRAHMLLAWGKKREARDLISRYTLTSFEAAFVCVALNDKEKAFALLEKAIADHEVNIINIKVDPALDPIRNDPRFDALLRELGLL